MFGGKTLAKICVKQTFKVKARISGEFSATNYHKNTKTKCLLYTINLTRLSLFERNTCSMYAATYCKLKGSFI